MSFTISKKTALQINIASVLVTIAQVETIQLPQGTLSTTRVKGLEDSNSTVMVNGDVEGDQVTASIFHDPLDAQHYHLLKTVNSPDFTEVGFAPNERNKAWNIILGQLATPKNWAFTGVPTKYTVNANVGEVLKSNLTIEVEKTTTLPV